jgi:hypothetical protein
MGRTGAQGDRSRGKVTVVAGLDAGSVSMGPLSCSASLPVESMAVIDWCRPVTVPLAALRVRYLRRCRRRSQ